MQPTAYARLYNLTQYAALNSAAPYNAAQHDAEFNAIALTLSETLANLALIQRDDGALRNAIVTPDSLDTATLNLIGEWAPKGPWLPAQAYAVRDMVTILSTSTSYVCAVAHTSTAFATDLALGYWQQVNGQNSGATTVTFTTNDRILGRVSAGAGDGEEIVATAFARSLLDDADAATARTTLGLGSTSDPTFDQVTAASLTLSGLTALSFLYSGTAGLLTTTAAPTNGQLLVGSTGAAPVAAALTGTANQVTVTNGAGSITLALPQSIHNAATPTFATVNLTNLSTGRIPIVGASSALVQDALYFDLTTNSLGVNVASPLSILHIDGGLDPTTFRMSDGSDYYEWTEGGVDMSLVWANGVTSWGLLGMRGDATAPYVTIATNNLNIGGAAGGGVGSWKIELHTPAANVLEQRVGTAAQTWRLYNTYTSATNFERGFARWATNVFEVGTEAGGGGGTNRAMALLSATSVIGIGGMAATFPALKRSTTTLQTKLADDSAFTRHDALDFYAQAAGTLGWDARAKMTSPADSQVLLTNAAGADFARLMFGGTTASFPALVRSATSLHLKLADNSAFSDLILATLVAGAASSIGWLGSSITTSPSDGVIRLTNNAATDFGRLQLGGTTSSFPALKRSSTAIHARLADDSAYAPFSAELVTVAAGTATPAGGSTAARLLFGTTAGLGIYYGSGAPSVSAAQGSLYMRSDGSSTSTRMYVNTDGGTTWTNVTTAA